MNNDPTLDYRLATNDHTIHLYWTTPFDITITIDRLKWDGGNCHGELSVTLEGRPLIEYKRINCQSNSQTNQFVTKLNRTDKTIGWDAYLETACGQAIRHLRSVGQLIDVRTIQDPGPPQWLLEDYWPDIARPSLIFGDAESHKSVIALALITAVQTGQATIGEPNPVIPQTTGPVAYIDYEDDPSVFAHRYRRLVTTLGITADDAAPIFYYHPAASLDQIAEPLAGQFRKEGVVAAIVDSRGAAQQGNMNDNADTNAFFNAVTALETQTLVIDHLAKADVRTGQPQKHSFGAVQTRGRVASSWHVRRNNTNRSSGVYTVTLTDAKWSHGPERPTRSLDINWSEGGLEIHRRPTVFEEPTPRKTQDKPDIPTRLKASIHNEPGATIHYHVAELELNPSSARVAKRTLLGEKEIQEVDGLLYPLEPPL